MIKSFLETLKGNSKGRRNSSSALRKLDQLSLRDQYTRNKKKTFSRIKDNLRNENWKYTSMLIAQLQN